MLNACLNWAKTNRALKVKNYITPILVSTILDKFVEFFDLAKFLDLIIFVFLDLGKLDINPLPTTLLILAPIAIGTDLSNNLIVFNIKLSDTAILLKL